MFRVATLLMAILLAVSTASAADKPALGKKGPELLFKKLDQNKDGKLSLDEFKKLGEMGKGRLKDKTQILEQLFQKLDADSDGFVTLDEFKKLSELRRQKGTEGAKEPN